MTDEEIIYHLKLHAQRHADVAGIDALRKKIGTLELRLLTLQKRVDRIVPRRSKEKR